MDQQTTKLWDCLARLHDFQHSATLEIFSQIFPAATAEHIWYRFCTCSDFLEFLLYLDDSNRVALMDHIVADKVNRASTPTFAQGVSTPTPPPRQRRRRLFTATEENNV